MVGTGVLMSQLLLEYVLDTTQDLEKRQWVYELCLHMSHVTCAKVQTDASSSLWLQFHSVDTFEQSLVIPKNPEHGAIEATQGILWYCFESDLFRL